MFGEQYDEILTIGDVEELDYITEEFEDFERYNELAKEFEDQNLYEKGMM